MRFFIPVTVAAAALPLFAAACSPASSPGTSAPGAGGTSSAAASPNAGPLTGTQLKALLAPAAWFPSGFTPDPNGSVDTGDSYQPISPPGPLACKRLNGTAWVQLGGVGAVSFAQNDYINQNAGQYAQEIDEYQGTGAQDVMAGLRKLAGTCPSFRDSQTSSTVTVKLKKGPNLGDDALTFILHSPRWQGDTSLEAIRVGTAVVTVFYSGTSGTGTPQATKLAAAVTANLTKKI